MHNLQIVRSAQFGSIPCDFYRHKQEIWMTRRQIGEALGYADPQKAVDKIHSRNQHRLDQLSTTVKLTGVEGGREVEREIVIYSAKGIYEICRWSGQPQANAFFDWVYDVLEQIRKTGKYDPVQSPDAVLKRKLSLAATLGRGLGKSQQVALRRIAVKQAAEESGADYADIIAVLEEPAKAIAPSDSDAVERLLGYLDKHPSVGKPHNGYLYILPMRFREILRQLKLDYRPLMRELSDQELIRSTITHESDGRQKVYFTVKSPVRLYSNKTRCVAITAERDKSSQQM